MTTPSRLIFLLAAVLAYHHAPALGRCSSSEAYLNDNFDASTTINTTNWASFSGVRIQKACTTNSTNAVLKGNVLVFGATGDASRYLTSNSLNLMNAQMIEFDAAACLYPGTTSTIKFQLAYSTDNGTTYKTAKIFTVERGGPGAHAIVTINDAMNGSAVHLQIKQISSFSGKESQAWALDNFVVMGQRTQTITEDFNGGTACNIIERSSSDVKPYCSSPSDALIFSGKATSSIGHFATSVPVMVTHTGIIPESTGDVFSEEFETIPSIPGKKWASIAGGHISIPECGAIDSTGAGYAAYFNETGLQSIETESLDLVDARSLFFKIRFRGGSKCGSSVSNTTSIVVEYQVQKNTPFIQLLQLNSHEYMVATTVNVTIPSTAQTNLTVLRWRKISNSGLDSDVWAIDHVSIPHFYEEIEAPGKDKVIFSEHFDKIPTIGGAKWASIWGGAFLTPDCGSIDLPGFSSQAAYFQQHGTRSIQTQSLDLSQAITLSFRVRIGGSYGSSCESADPNEDVVVEYRPAGSHSFRQLKLLAYNAYLTATTVVISLPVAAQTTATAIRWRQLSNSGLYTDEWAIDAISIIAIISSPTAITKPVAALTLTTIFSDNFDTTPKIPGNYWRAMSGGTFTTPVCGSIDLPGFSSRAAFFSYSGSRYIQTVSLDLTSAQTVSFRILIGGENSYSSCENADSGESVVLEYSTANSSSFTEILTLQYFAYRNATTVTVAIPFAAKSVSTALQWRQLSNSGSSFDEWALDHVDIKGYAHSSGSPLTTIFMEDFDPTPLFPGTRWQTISAGSIKTPDCGSIDLPGFSSKAAVFHYYGSRYIQTSPLNLIYARTLSFRIQIGGGSWLCRDAGYGEDVVVEYQISGSSTFSQLYLLRYYEYRSAQTVTIAVPTSVKTENTVLRWRQLSNSGYYEDVWAIDHIQITGSTPAPWSYIFSEDFFPLPTFGGTKWLSIHGGTVAIPNCGAIDLPSYSAEAAFFYDGGVRSIQTQALNLVLAEMLSFRVQIGGGYGCVAADVGQDVVVEYQAQGSPVFHQITKLKYDGYEIAKTVTVPIPTAARTNATYIRWKQLSNFTGNYNQYGIGKWALDHVRITWSAENQPSVVEFQLCMGCNSPYFHQQSASYDIQLEYSVDYGQTWDLVEECQQSSYMCTQTMVSSQYSSFLFKQWRRLVVLLPFLAISNNTEIRWRQSSSATGIEWAIDNIYIGVRCPRFCNGHGHCTKPNGQYQGLVCGGNSDGNPCAKSFTYNGETYHGCTRDGREGIDNQLWCSTTTDFDNDRKWGYCVCGICQCDSGYSGVACEKTNQALPQVLSELFEDELSTSKWAWVAGGSIDTTCGTIGSGNSMIFNLGRTRLLESTDLNLTQSYSLQFTAQVGSSKVGCPRPTESKNNIFIQYSINGGVTWNLMQIIPFFFGTSPAQQNVVIPNAAKTPSTRIRWYQASASGSNLDVWAIDDVYIDAVLSSLPVVETFDPSSSFMWRSLTGSKVERYCSSTSDTLHFSQSSATHGFARTVSLHLTQATYIQFDIVVDCGQTLPSSAAYVTLQYSTDSGKRWWRLDDGCLPHSFSCASLRRPSVYRSGLYSTWKRVTILLNDTHLASMPAAVVQLQWLGNKASIAYDWAIDNVYIGEGCPGVCSGHGRCTSKGTCACDVGYKNSQCSSYDGTRPRQIKEQFDHVIPSSLSVTGGSISDDCGVLSAGTALTFNLAGEREIVTSEMDATNVHYIQFVYMTGSLSGAGTGCTAVRSSSQVPIVDYSIDGGVTWTTLEVLRYYDYTQTSAGINIRIPMAAQTRATYFRLWQYNFYSSDSATWTLDDLFIGGYTPGNGSTLFETFSPLKASNWLFYPSGRVVNGKCSAQTPALYFDGTGEGQQYATTKPFALQVDPYQLISVPFDSSLPIGWNITGAKLSTTCGILDSGAALVFSNIGVREITTPDMDTTIANEVQFYLLIGGNPLRGGYCDNSEEDAESVRFYYSTDFGQNWTLWETYQYHQYRDPRMVTELLPTEAQTANTRLRWVQQNNDGLNKDVWSIDSIVISKYTSMSHYVAQFDINVGCEKDLMSGNGSISFDFVTHDGNVSDWTKVEQDCVPGYCWTGNYQKGSSYHMGIGWQRITIPLPSDVITKAVQFRWYQSSPSSVPWAIDTIYIGHNCPMSCSGHGRCMPGYCFCDVGYTGSDCSFSLLPLLTELKDDFSNGAVDSKKWSSYQGVNGTQPVRCGPVSGPSALLFSEPGPRQITTVDMNTATVQFLQFRIRIGTYRWYSSTCDVIDRVDEGVLVHYSNNGGLTWQLLVNLYYAAYTNPGYVSVDLPTGARSSSTRFRWWQPHNDGLNKDEWVLGDVFIGGTVSNLVTLEETFDPIDGGNWLFYPNGQVQPFCQNATVNSSRSGNAMVFAGSVGERFITTRDFLVVPNTVLYFDLNIGCGSSFSSDQYNVQLQYSTNRGHSWNLIYSHCYPYYNIYCYNYGYQRSTSYRAGDFGRWRYVSVSLPSETVGNQTRFRWYQSSYSTAFTWGIDNIFIGESCPNMCNGHGRCRSNANSSGVVCECDYGYGGIDCRSTAPLPTTFTETFEDQASLQDNWSLIVGGTIGSRCGVVATGKSLSFYEYGPRKAVTRDLNLTSSMSLNFYIHFSGSYCSGYYRYYWYHPVLVQYSSNDGATWTDAISIYYYQYRSPGEVKYTLPHDAKTPSTRFRWWQPYDNGYSNAVWSIDEIYFVGQPTNNTEIVENFTSVNRDVWTHMHGSTIGSLVCNSPHYAPSLQFYGASSERFLHSGDFLLNSGAVIQFSMLMGCNATFTTNRAIYLKYSWNGGSYWSYVQDSCQKEYYGCSYVRYSSSYYSGSFSTWRRVTLALSSSIANLTVPIQFRWRQQTPVYSYTNDSWALDNIYIGSDCPLGCNGHGQCMGSGNCNCDSGYSGPTCSVVLDSLPSLFRQSFEHETSSNDWLLVVGGGVDQYCGMSEIGTSLVFTGYPQRQAITVDLDTRNTKLYRYTLRMGGNHCPYYWYYYARGIAFQYSTNGGISWTELQFTSYDNSGNPHILSGELPTTAQGPSTRFRWLQVSSYLYSQEGVWSIDDVYIGSGVYPSSLLENFNPINDNNWVFRGSSAVTGYCGSTGLSLVFSGSSSPRFAVTEELKLKQEGKDLFTWNGESTGSSFASVTGGSLGRPCTSIGPSNVIFFSKGNARGTINRQAITKDIDTTTASYISFYIVIGGSSGDCDAAEVSEGVQLSFSNDGGKTWTVLKTLAYDDHGKFDVVKISLPSSAKSIKTRFRWMQGSYTDNGLDTWALGNIRVKGGNPSPDHQLQFDLVFTCNGTDASVDSYVKLQMSTEDNLNWTDVNTFCQPPGGSDSSIPVCNHAINFNAPSRWFWHGNDHWKRITVSLKNTALPLGERTLFRFTQGGRDYSASTQPFAIDNVSIGRSCPNFCSGHGMCLNGTCLCDPGFSGPSCGTADTSLKQSLVDSFESPWSAQKRSQWESVIGGHFGSSCSFDANSVIIMNGASSLRQVTTVDLDTRLLWKFAFTFMLGGGGDCSVATRGEDVYLSYSKNGGVTWNLIQTFSYEQHGRQQTIDVSSSIPQDARADGVRFQWSQYLSDSSFSGVWTIDDITIGPSCLDETCQNGATCIETATPGSHTCICPPEFTGLVCDTAVCDLHPCYHGGTCHISAETGLPSCICTEGYRGPACNSGLPTQSPPAPSTGNEEGTSIWVYVLVAVGFALILIVIIGIIILYRRRVVGTYILGGDPSKGLHLENPMFDASDMGSGDIEVDQDTDENPISFETPVNGSDNNVASQSA